MFEVYNLAQEVDSVEAMGRVEAITERMRRVNERIGETRQQMIGAFGGKLGELVAPLFAVYVYDPDSEERINTFDFFVLAQGVEGHGVGMRDPRYAYVGSHTEGRQAEVYEGMCMRAEGIMFDRGGIRLSIPGLDSESWVLPIEDFQGISMVNPFDSDDVAFPVFGGEGEVVEDGHMKSRGIRVVMMSGFQNIPTKEQGAMVYRPAMSLDSVNIMPDNMFHFCGGVFRATKEAIRAQRYRLE